MPDFLYFTYNTSASHTLKITASLLSHDRWSPPPLLPLSAGLAYWTQSAYVSPVHFSTDPRLRICLCILLCACVCMRGHVSAYLQVCERGCVCECHRGECRIRGSEGNNGVEQLPAAGPNVIQPLPSPCLFFRSVPWCCSCWSRTHTHAHAHTHASQPDQQIAKKKKREVKGHMRTCAEHAQSQKEKQPEFIPKSESY